MSTEAGSTKAGDRGGRDARHLVMTRELVATMVLFAVLLAAMIAYNVRATNTQAAKAMQINVATHQEQLVNNYVQAVVLASNGVVADPGPTRDQMVATAGALLNGGSVPNPDSAGDRTSVLTGNAQPIGTTVSLPRVGDWKLRRKLQQESALMAKLVVQGGRVLAEGSGSATYAADLLTLRIDGDQAETIATDAAYQLSTDVQASMSRLASVEVVLGILSGLAAFGMALLLARSATRQSSRFRSLVTNASDIICVTDAIGRLTYGSPSTQRVLGYPPDDLIGTSVLDLVHPDDRDAVMGSLSTVAAQPGGVAVIAGRMRRSDGEWRDMEGTATNLADDPTIGGFVLNGRDVTDARRATADLALARDDALAAVRTKSEFLAMMSHEIRTPMNAVIGLTELLLGPTLSAEQLEYGSGVKASAESLLVIINDILDFSKIEAGKVDIESVELDLVRIADQVGRMVVDTAHIKGLELLVDTSPDLPATLFGDPVRVQQVLLNLAGNAVKFTGHGEVVIRVRLLNTTRRACPHPLRGHRHRHRHRPRRPGAVVHAVPAGRLVDHPPLRRYGPRPGDLPATGRADGRHDGLDQRSRRGLASSGSSSSSRWPTSPTPRTGARRRGSTGARRSSSTTTRPTGSSSASTSTRGACSWSRPPTGPRPSPSRPTPRQKGSLSTSPCST